MELGLLHVWIQCFNRCKHHRRLCSYHGVLLTLHTIAYMIITTPCMYVCVCLCVYVCMYLCLGEKCHIWID